MASYVIIVATCMCMAMQYELTCFDSNLNNQPEIHAKVPKVSYVLPISQALTVIMIDSLDDQMDEYYPGW